MKRYPTGACVGNYEKLNVQKLGTNQSICKKKKSNVLIDGEKKEKKR